MVESSNPEPTRHVDIAELILKNRKRTFKMFLDESKEYGSAISASNNIEVLKMKLQTKINASYAKIGEIPDITVDEFKRKKILKELKISSATV